MKTDVPRVVVEGPEEALSFAVSEASASGWLVVPGFGAPFESARVARSGSVDSEETARAALLAAVAGQGLVVHASASRETIDRLVDDLRRLGPVDHRVGSPARQPTIGPDARAILGLLAEGHSLGEAANLLGVSRRTADRRLAEGRRALGVARTTEAVARARRLGWVGAPTERS